MSKNIISPIAFVKSDFKVDKEAWIVLSLKFEIFRLGRLQFQAAKWMEAE